MSAEIGCPPKVFAALFPFHLALDAHLRIRQVGDALQNAYPQIRPGDSLDQHFRIVRPAGTGDFESVWARQQSVFLLGCVHSPLQLRGQMVHVPGADTMFFLGSPWVRELSAVAELGFSVGDFAIHDLSSDLLLLLQAQNTALAEARQLTQQLTGQRTQLRQAHAALQQAHDELERRVAERTAALQEANARLEALATTDPLTGLPNHRALVTALDQEIERSHRFGRPCAVIFFDLDHFKALNDGCGHEAGDAVLRELGLVARAALRGMDTVGRWGGEEFVALLPETDAAEAAEAAERVRAAIAGHLFPAGGGVRLTCSLGVALFPSDARDRAGLVRAADQAMYAAKHLGRNQVRLASDPAVRALQQSEAESREEAALTGVVEALTSLIESRDDSMKCHTTDVATLALHLAGVIGLNPAEARMVGLVGRLRDIGKVAIPDSILHKSTSLTTGEWDIVRRHPAAGAAVVDRIPSLRAAAAGIRAHHERWDGRGYPDNLSGDNIPLAARIVAVADAYAAMTEDRPYRSARSAADALAEVRRCAGSQFDPMVVTALECLEVPAPAVPNRRAA